jgi:hypothetical protein
MKIIECKCCSSSVRVSDYDFARFSQGEFILCEECNDNFENNLTKCSRS